MADGGLRHIGDIMRNHDRSQVFTVLLLPGDHFPGWAGRGVRPQRRCAGSLDSRVHIGMVIIADIKHLVAAFHGAGERLQPDVVGAPVAPKGNEPDLFIIFPLFLQGSIRSLNPTDCRRRILEGIMNERDLPGGIGEKGGGYFQATGGTADYYRMFRRQQDLTNDDWRSTTGTSPVSSGEKVFSGCQFFQCGHFCTSLFPNAQILKGLLYLAAPGYSL